MVLHGVLLLEYAQLIECLRYTDIHGYNVYLKYMYRVSFRIFGKGENAGLELKRGGGGANAGLELKRGGMLVTQAWPLEGCLGVLPQKIFEISDAQRSHFIPSELNHV